MTKQICIQFTGDGAKDAYGDPDELATPKYKHAFPSEGMSDYTLCGMSLDGDPVTVGTHIQVFGYVNCPTCICIIKHCRDIKFKSLLGKP